MARRSFVRSSALRQGQRRQTEWGSITSSAYATVAAASKLNFASFTGAQLSTIVPATIVRVRGTFSIASDQGAALEDQIGAVGILVVQELARAAGAASLPSPFTDAKNDAWFAIQGFQQRQASDAAGPSIQYPFDSKSMRKIEDGNAIVLMVENGHASFGLKVNLYLRILFKLH